MFHPVGIVTMRMIVDVGNWEETRFVLAGGQSGNPTSPHYGDMHELWRKGELTRMAWSREAIRRATVSELRLVAPQRARTAAPPEPQPRPARAIDLRAE